MVYSVKQICETLSISRRQAYYLIDKLKLQCPYGIVTERNGDCNGDCNGNFRQKLFVNDKGFEFIKSALSSRSDFDNTAGSAGGSVSGDDKSAEACADTQPAPRSADTLQAEYIEFLKSQIEIKDKQIENLQEQLKNYSQSVLIGQQSKFIPETIETLTEPIINAETKKMRRFLHIFKKE